MILKLIGFFKLVEYPADVICAYINRKVFEPTKTGLHKKITIPPQVYAHSSTFQYFWGEMWTVDITLYAQ